ncbi:hypothetical protein CXF95_10040 [Paraglaciecola sp. MB-3u-78]|nr:hypothetical protein CXF95_10040 [Paraglaciecola sp. MB-3u-78]
MMVLLINSVKADEHAIKYSLQKDYATSFSVITSFFDDYEEPVITHSEHDQNFECSCGECYYVDLVPSHLFIELSNLILVPIEQDKEVKNSYLAFSVQNHISSSLFHPP